MLNRNVTSLSVWQTAILIMLACLGAFIVAGFLMGAAAKKQYAKPSPVPVPATTPTPVSPAPQVVSAETKRY